VFVVQLESELLRVERDGTANIFDLIPNTAHPENEGRLCSSA
jgi:hypothetical protein